jgi:hypothetical protein
MDEFGRGPLYDTVKLFAYLDIKIKSDVRRMGLRAENKLQDFTKTKQFFWFT